ncbi:hypothetical protein L596_011557 [Steinernema carpocapsae]|uniref:E2F/DP family winged-helix DNA-binding domain-containing protein n=1 Tax=Steinernema carpocapsae TaxID=34508 RepID=A0A4U5NV57_STECR|nr:hypothetical protein L596_011557 [Steinernema carpocapsae]
MAENVAPQMKLKQEASEEIDVCTVEQNLPQLEPAQLARKTSTTKINRKRSLDASDEDETVSRKEKSLGKLCQKFLTVMQEEERKGRDIHLETVAKSMNVEKRRIYDIVNVMEALDAMAKTNKSYYKWHGLRKLPQLMANLQRQGNEEGLPQRVAQVEQAMCQFTVISKRHSSAGSELVGSLIGVDDREVLIPESPQSSQSSIVSLDTLPTLGKQRGNRDRQGQNSLANLCRRFLMVLLCNPNDERKVSLDVASTVLIKDPETEGFEPPSRSRCRRLYDIANVLVAMNLIKKVHYLFGTKKIPLFVYCGPNPDASQVNWEVNLATPPASQSPPPAKRHSGHFGLAELAEIAERERKLLEAQASSASPPVNDENANPLEAAGLVKPTPKPSQVLMTNEMTRTNPFRVFANRSAQEDAIRYLHQNIMGIKPINSVWKPVGLVNRSPAILNERQFSPNQLPLSPIYQIHNPATNSQSGHRITPRKSFPLTVVRPKASIIHSVSNILGVRNQNSLNQSKSK